MTQYRNNFHDEREPYSEADQNRIRREVIILEEQEEDTNEAYPDDNDNHQTEVETEAEQHAKPKDKPWMIFTTGAILTDGTLPYYRYFIAIAVMCFISIVLTFMSLNADREFRSRETYAAVLHERSVLKEEERYGLASRSAVLERLKEHGIELVELSKESRLIEK